MIDQTCQEKDCQETETVECRLLMFKGDMPLWYVLRSYGFPSFWELLTRGSFYAIDYYCAEHCQKNGYCYGCGGFWAGAESFDFSRNGLCSNCRDDSDLVGYDDDDEDYYEMPNDYYSQEYEAEPDYEEEE